MWRVVLTTAMLGGCGRIGFDVAASDASDGGRVDALATQDGTGPMSQAVQHASRFVMNMGAVAVSLPQPVTANDRLIVATSTTASNTIELPVDSLGSSFALLLSGRNAAPGDSQAAIFLATVPTSGADTITCQITPIDNIHCHVYEVRMGSSTVDSFGLQFIDGAALAVSTQTPTTAGDYVFAYFAANNSMATFSAGPGFADAEATTSASNDDAFSEDESSIAAGVQTATATSNSVDDFACLVVALLP